MNKPLLKEIISYIREKDSSIEIDLTTNGVFLNANLLSWLKNMKVDLAVSIDGDLKTQVKNRKGITPKIYNNFFKSAKPFLKEITFNMVMAPNNISNFAANFLYLRKKGVRKFNLLPAAYILWSGRQIKVLKEQLDTLLFFLRRNRDIHLKNCDRTGDLFFLDTGIIIDPNGDIFSTDAVALKRFQGIKNVLKINNVNNIDSFDFIKRNDAQQRIKDSVQLVKSSTRKNILRSNETIDALMDKFVAELKTGNREKKIVDIKIGYQCNNKCFFCAQGDKREICSFRGKKEIEKELAKARKNCASVVFTGGEPTLHPSFLDLVEFARKLKFETIQIQTNGRMFGYNKFCIEAIRRGGNNIIEFSPSLHGHKASLHDYLTSASGSFQQTVQGIKNLKALGQRVITNSVITSLNYRYLPALARLLVKLDVDQFQFAFAHIVGTAKKNRKWLVPRKLDVMPYVKKGLDIGKKAGKVVTTEAIPYCLMIGYEDCVAEQIIPDGKVIEKDLVVESFATYRRNFGKTKAKKCGKCVYFSVCEGP